MRALILFLLGLFGYRPATGRGGLLVPESPPAGPPTFDSPGDPEENRYWTDVELKEAVEKSRVREAAGDENPGADIPYPMCADCGFRHPSEKYLEANTLCICERCGRVQKAAVSNRHESGRTIDVTATPAHRNQYGRWCVEGKKGRRRGESLS